MSQLRNSENYIWSTHDVLGQGATGAVYKARHKRTGMLFAVKTFNQKSHMRPPEVQTREFDVMLKLNHNNIVKLLAIEEEVSQHSKVLVMELCTGGSLYNMLDDPTNAFGLEEREFFRVVQDVAAGMKHIRDQGIIHRDIKPGNIMRYISEDGRAIFKLTDFGAARELDEEEQFMSLYGTEEYLHPDLYERAVLRRPTSVPFAATVDLWSLGVTFFHVAAGQLPFRPYGGRRNRETMYMITTEKESGVISGVQHSDDGPIEWSRDLPRHCRLSLGARRLIVPLLAGLMECVPNKMWSFDQFFAMVHEVVTKHRIYVFSVGTGTLLTVYIDHKEKFAKLCEEIASQTDIPANRQVLFYNNSLLVKHINHLQPVDSYPKTTSENPILLFRNEYSDYHRCPAYDIPQFPSFMAQISLDNDYKVAKTCTGILYLVDRYVQMITHSRRFFNMSVAVYLFGLRNEIEQVRQHVSQFEVVCRETDHRTAAFANSHKTQRQLLELFLCNMPGPETDSKEQVRQFLDDLEGLTFDHKTSLAEVFNGVSNMRKYIDDYHKKVVINRELEKPWRDTTYDIERDRYIERLELPLKTARQILTEFSRDRSIKRIPFNDEQIHNFDKMKMGEICRSSSSIFDCCKHNLERDFEEYHDWFKTASSVRVKLCRLQMQVRTLADRHMNAAEKLDMTHFVAGDTDPTSKVAISNLKLLPPGVKSQQITLTRQDLCWFLAMDEHHKKMQDLIQRLDTRSLDRPLSLAPLTLEEVITPERPNTGGAPSSLSSSASSVATTGDPVSTLVDQYVQVSPPAPEPPPRSTKIAGQNRSLLQQLNQNIQILKTESGNIKDVIQENTDLLKQLEELAIQTSFPSNDSGLESV